MIINGCGRGLVNYRLARGADSLVERGSQLDPSFQRETDRYVAPRLSDTVGRTLS